MGNRASNVYLSPVCSLIVNIQESDRVNMNKKHTTALVNYLEFSLIKMIEEVEGHVDHEVKQALYTSAATLVRDVEDGLRVSSKLVVDQKIK